MRTSINYLPKKIQAAVAMTKLQTALDLILETDGKFGELLDDAHWDKLTMVEDQLSRTISKYRDMVDEEEA